MTEDIKDIIKNRILDKAKYEFAKHGYSKVKTESLAVDSGISKRTLYENFPSKEILLSEIIDSELKHVKEHLESVVKKINEPDADFVRVLKALWNIMSISSSTFTKEFFEDLKKYAPAQWAKIESFRVEQIKSNFTKLHSFGVKKGYIKSNIDKDVFYLIFHYSFNNILIPEIVCELHVSTKEAMENIIDVLLTGSLTDKGRSEYIDNKKLKTG